ncbi:thiamine pyrophosphate-binding protein [Modestobacter roseus]|uniref:thiamine pyrophosphate-binding protein n=1 Tax=Modestobacter roseus TaxID=1181884 RepID=UPI0034DEA19D
MRVAEAIGQELARQGLDQVFGVVGSGNFYVTNALVGAGARFVATRHEAGAATMADAYARTTQRVAAVTVHQGCGLTNALTGLTEAAKSRTPLLVLAADTAGWNVLSNFNVDQPAVLRGLGIESETITSAGTAVQEAVRAFRRAAVDRRTVVLNLPLDIQEAEVPDDAAAPLPLPVLETPVAGARSVEQLADLLRSAERPVLIAGRGARLSGARDALAELGELSGALLATSGVARGLFAGHEWSIDVSGGFASPLAAELISSADLVVGWGASLNVWTLRAGQLVGPDATVVQIDEDPAAIGRHVAVDHGIVGDVRATAEAAAESLRARPRTAAPWRSPELQERIRTRLRWRDEPYEDTSTDALIDPRTLTIALDDILPKERVVAPDGGNFNGYPAMFLEVPDERGFCLTLAFQSIGLGLSTAIGAGLASPGRIAVAGVGDGGFMMSHVELDTAVRLELPLAVIVYNDHAYSAETHHFGPEGHPLDIVQFPETDIASIARGYGCDAVTVRTPEDLKAVQDWVAGPRRRPIVIDARITDFASWMIAHSFATESQAEDADTAG